MKEPRALEEYRRAIVAACPELADAAFAILASGWHSTAVEVGGRWVFKFPRGAGPRRRCYARPPCYAWCVRR